MLLKSPQAISIGSLVIMMVALSSTSTSSGQSGALVRLQPSSPGIAQTGHINVTGGVIAGGFGGNGALLTNLNADNISAGTLAIARLPANTALLIGAQTFTGVKTFSAPPAFTNAAAPFSVTSATRVDNLNADLIDGLDSSMFANLAQNQTWTGANTFSNAANSFVGNGAGLTALSASAISTGTLSDSRLSSSVMTLHSFQTVTGTKTFTGSVAFNNATIPFSVASTALVTNLNADRLDGFSSSDFARLNFRIQSIGSSGPEMLYVENTSGSNVSIGISGVTSSPTGNVWGVYGLTNSDAGTGVRGFANASSGVTTGGSFTASSPAGRGVTASGGSRGVIGSSNEAGGSGVEGVSNGSSGNGVFGRVWVNSSSSSTYGGWFENLSGVGGGLRATSNSIYGLNVDTTGPSNATYAVFANVASTSGRAVYGNASATSGDTWGGIFSTASTSGIGVEGRASATSGVTFGGNFLVYSNVGRAVNALASHASGGYGGYFEAVGTTGTAVYGEASNTTGLNTGGHFRTSSSQGRGVYAVAAAQTGTTYAAQLLNLSDDGTGVYSEANGDNAKAVYGRATAVPVAATPYGVYGSASVLTSGSAVHAQGDMTASGVKPFRIDHPQDPLNKYLFHFASESPFPQNFYNGNVTTDAKGYAWVELPTYFADINTNIKYQLTVVDEADSEEFVLAKVVSKVKDNRFRIRTNVPHVEVSWMVFADRNDARVQFNRPTDVRDKVGREKGKYQHPEYYGQPSSMGVDYDPVRETSREKK